MKVTIAMTVTATIAFGLTGDIVYFALAGVGAMADMLGRHR